MATVRCKFAVNVLDENGTWMRGAYVTITDISPGTEIGSGQTGGTGWFQVTALGEEGIEYDHAYIIPTPPVIQAIVIGRGYEPAYKDLAHIGSASEPKPGGGFAEFEYFKCVVNMVLDEKLLKTIQVAKRLGVSPSTVRRRVTSGKLPEPIRRKGKLFWTEEDLK